MNNIISTLYYQQTLANNNNNDTNINNKYFAATNAKHFKIMNIHVHYSQPFWVIAIINNNNEIKYIMNQCYLPDTNKVNGVHKNKYVYQQ